ncbi:MAG: serine--tRNA ligase, partial [Candidatus Moraniibacteriota bacterium]
MLDIKFIRENADKLKEAIKNKNIKLDLDELLAVDKKRVEMLQYIELLSAEKNKLNDLMQMSKTDDERKTAIEQGKAVKEKMAKAEPEYAEVKKQFEALMVLVPIIPSEDTPVGLDESGNV